MLALHTFGAVVVINVLDLVPDHCCQLILAVHQFQQPATHVNMSARQGKGIDEVRTRNVVKLVGQFSMRIAGHLRPHPRQVMLHDGDLGRVFPFFPGGVEPRQLISDADLFRVRHASETYRHSRQFLFGVGDQIQQRGGTGGHIHFPPLAHHHGGDGQQHNSREYDPALHKYWRNASRFRV